MECKHLEFVAEVQVNRCTASEDDNTVVAFRAELSIHCKDCMQPFRFIGVPGGYSPSYPTVGVEAIELRIPMVPFSSSPMIANVYEDN